MIQYLGMQCREVKNDCAQQWYIPSDKKMNVLKSGIFCVFMTYSYEERGLALKSKVWVWIQSPNSLLPNRDHEQVSISL